MQNVSVTKFIRQNELADLYDILLHIKDLFKAFYYVNRPLYLCLSWLLHYFPFLS
jgi:hypothetical protein